jgi:uncharacterized protein YjdB
MGIANEMKDQLTASYSAPTRDVIFESGDLSVVFDETAKKFVLKNGQESITFDENLMQLVLAASAKKITVDENLGITLNSGDAAIWMPSIMAVCPYTGSPHGGVGAGIIFLKGL